ncbi:UDP-glucose 4-epimerase [Bryocella elongata]|uniref:UDP-glucose 4-epimerase n=1 Tax=Bryocella elongata TaxID=863522 RepID=A0A1H5Y037_9BACT|nr:SDR family oxidoreductase [Bryocella elongata]SEG16980.1 UDP-glucose 4-epimerase [Bryocella elongata]
MSRILITGVAGFIGSSLARALTAEGATVRGIDNFSTGKLDNLEGLRNRIEFIEGDVQDGKAMESACAGCEYVFHQAAIPSVPLSVKDPVGTMDSNLMGTLQVLEGARKAGVRRLMYAASSAAYGDAPEQPKHERMLPAPCSPYAVQKLAGEHLIASYAHCYGLDAVSLRYFNIFGPRQDPGSPYSGVLAIFIAKMLAGETPVIYGDGSTSRDFTYIDNVVAANLRVAKTSAKVAGKVFNVATGKSTTLLEAYELIKRATGYKGDVAFRPEREGDILHSLADISLARETFGYEVVADFASGLEKTIAWCRQTSAVAV